MANIARLKIWIPGDTLTASDLNSEFNNILNDYNGNIDGTNVDSAAALSIASITVSGAVNF